MHLLGQYPAPLRLPRGLSKPQLRRVMAYIEDHLEHPLSLARLAGVAGGSASHLKTLFKRSTGLPVHAYVVQRRVERAKALLVRGELPASQVALAAGFAHQSHMARCMRRVLGVTPTAVVRGARPVSGGTVTPRGTGLLQTCGYGIPLTRQRAIAGCVGHPPLSGSQACSESHSGGTTRDPSALAH